MKKLLTLVVLISVLGISGLKAQQDAQYSFYMFNNLYFNPAYTGKKEAINFELLHRQQWRFFGIGKSIEGAPQSTTFTIHAPFKRSNNALGFMFHNDVIGPFNNSRFTLNYAYRIPVGQKLKLSFGVRGSYNLYHSSNVDFIRPDNTANVVNSTANLHKFNAGAGVYLWNRQDRFYVGFSVPHLIQNVLYTDIAENDPSNNLAQEHLHYFLTAGYVTGNSRSKFRVYPSMMMKFVKQTPIDFDINLNFLVYERLWLGAGYRFGGNIYRGNVDDAGPLPENYSKIGRGDAVIGMIRFLASQRLEIGYAYDHTLSSLGDFNNGSHELMINFNLEKRINGPRDVRITTPRYVNYF